MFQEDGSCSGVSPAERQSLRPSLEQDSAPTCRLLWPRRPLSAPARSSSERSAGSGSDGTETALGTEPKPSSLSVYQ